MFRNFQPLTREHCIRTILAGDINTGKRTLINGFIDGGYPCSAGCMCDIVIKQLYANQRKIQVEVYRSLKHDGGLSQLDNSFLRGGDCYALICDLTDAQTISSLPSWRTKCLEKFDPERPVATPFILLANKIDIIRDNNTKIRDFEKGKVLPLWFYNLPKEYETQKVYNQNIADVKEFCKAYSVPCFPLSILTKEQLDAPFVFLARRHDNRMSHTFPVEEQDIFLENLWNF